MAVDHENLARLDLNLLVVFDALLQEGHVTRAASRLGIGQSTMSHHLKRLRELFGDSLFERVPSGVAPTPYARELGTPVAEALQRLQRAVLSERRFDPASDVRRFRLGITDGLEVLLLPPVLAETARVAPGVTLVARPVGEASAAELDGGELDLVVGWPEHGAPHLKSRTLCSEGFSCLFDPTRVDAVELSLDAFLALPHVRVLGRAGGADAVDEALSAKKRRRVVAFETSRALAAPYAVKGASLVAVLPESAAAAAAAELGLSTCPVPLELPERSIVLLWHPSRDDAAQRWLRGVVTRAGAAVRDAAVRDAAARRARAQKIASGLTGEPVPPGTSSGAKTKKKSTR